MEKERQKLLDKRRRQEQDLRRLQRKRALIAAVSAFLLELFAKGFFDSFVFRPTIKLHY